MTSDWRERVRVQTQNQQINKLWRSSAQHSDYRQHHCIIHFKAAKRPDLNCFHQKKK